MTYYFIKDGENELGPFTISQLKSKVAQQQKGMEVLAAQLKEQDSKLQRVSDQLELSKPAPQTVLNDQR